jgi:hypothetical protein
MGDERSEEARGRRITAWRGRPTGPESCGFNAPDRGFLRANVTWPFAKVRFAAAERSLVVDTPSLVMPRLSYTFTPAG